MRLYEVLSIHDSETNSIFNNIKALGFSEKNIKDIFYNADASEWVSGLQSLKDNNINITESLIEFLISLAPGYISRINSVTHIPEHLLLKIAKLKKTNILYLLDIPNISDDVLIAAIKAKPARAKIIKNTKLNISDALSKIINDNIPNQQKAPSSNVKNKSNITRSVDNINDLSETELKEYFKKVHIDRMFKLYTTINNPPDSVTKIVLKRNPHLIQHEYFTNISDELQWGVLSKRSWLRNENTSKAVLLKIYQKDPHALYYDITHRIFDINQTDVQQVLINLQTIKPNNVNDLINSVKVLFNNNSLIQNKWIRYIQSKVQI